MGRIGGVNQTLVERVPGSVPFYKPPYDTSTAPGIEAFNSNQFQQGFSAGPKIDLIYHGDSGYGVELSYFNIFNQRATKIIGPDSPADWLVMKAPGAFWQTQDFPYQGMAWSSGTNLYNVEANGRLDITSRVTVLAGFRWLQLNDNLQGTLTPADLTQPTWKQTNSYFNLFQVTPGMPVTGNYPPFWTTSTTNNLYGVQIGVDGKILEFGRFSLDGVIKIGLFDNNAEQSTGVSLQKVVYPSTATTNHAAFVSDAGLQLKYKINDGLTVKLGYEALLFAGVALAPGQIQETYTTPPPPPSTVRALGVNCGSTVLFQGATAGFEYSF
ncbi:MAG: BBP7 family outer membrane beta-barrel protein [Xanthobacteraceae bacterium]